MAKQRSTHFRASLLGPPGLGMNNYVLNLEGFFMCENSICADFKSTLCNSTEKDELYVSEMIVMLAMTLLCVVYACIFFAVVTTHFSVGNPGRAESSAVQGLVE